MSANAGRTPNRYAARARHNDKANRLFTTAGSRDSYDSVDFNRLGRSRKMTMEIRNHMDQVFVRFSLENLHDPPGTVPGGNHLRTGPMPCRSDLAAAGRSHRPPTSSI